MLTKPLLHDAGTRRRTLRAAWVGGATMLMIGCGGDDAAFGLGPGGGTSTVGETLDCSVPSEQIYSGGPGKDGIPALSDPLLTAPTDPTNAYLQDADRVIGVFIAGHPVAVPLNILWWHEIVNLEVGGRALAVTHCPLTGSSLVFDREPLDGVEFGVSGLLYNNNLLMYNRSSGESLWPQMARAARCGPHDGTRLVMVPSIETTWAGWQRLHPNTFVVGPETGHARDYTRYPYGSYDEPSNPELLFALPTPIDTRRPPKERVLGIPEGETGGIALPFGELDRGPSVRVAEVVVNGDPVVVLWDAEVGGAAAYSPVIETGTALTLSVENGRIVDQETGSVWRSDGLALEGPLRHTRLVPVAEAYVAYWFAWAAFQPQTRIWNDD